MQLAVHLTTKAGTRAASNTRAFKLNETGMPVGNGTAAKLLEIVKYLDVKNSLRYKPGAGKTYCNIYAYDFVTLAGGYIPRCWWDKASADTIQKGGEVKPEYGKTLYELNANALYDWFLNYGSALGWKSVTTQDEAQRLANAGSLVIVSAAKKDGTPGHITAVVPENGANQAVRDAKTGKVTAMLQSNAGAVNDDFFSSVWWSDKYKPVKIWVFQK